MAFLQALKHLRAQDSLTWTGVKSPHMAQLHLLADSDPSAANNAGSSLRLQGRVYVVEAPPGSRFRWVRPLRFISLRTPTTLFPSLVLSAQLLLAV